MHHRSFPFRYVFTQAAFASSCPGSSPNINSGVTTRLPSLCPTSLCHHSSPLTSFPCIITHPHTTIRTLYLRQDSLCPPPPRLPHSQSIPLTAFPLVIIHYHPFRSPLARFPYPISLLLPAVASLTPAPLPYRARSLPTPNDRT